MGSMLGDLPSYDPHNFSQLRPSDPSTPSGVNCEEIEPPRDLRCSVTVWALLIFGITDLFSGSIFKFLTILKRNHSNLWTRSKLPLPFEYTNEDDSSNLSSYPQQDPSATGSGQEQRDLQSSIRCRSTEASNQEHLLPTLQIEPWRAVSSNNVKSVLCCEICVLYNESKLPAQWPPEKKQLGPTFKCCIYILLLVRMC
ncbi:hypothetical protein SDJN02_02817 [Cucurbita argyrosperma subsp. argyrosperma]|nr:hypothetical protein SDJN02_02817 [Cucurbita argyrosperma subsp. argyrosperma]